jgi:hypothetical protein
MTQGYFRGFGRTADYVGTAALGCPADRSSAICCRQNHVELRSTWTAEGGCRHVVRGCLL